MKKLRRIVAVILSLIMVLGSMTNVFAAGKSFKTVSFDITTTDGSDYEITGVWRVITDKAYEELDEQGNSGKYIRKNKKSFDNKTVFRIQVKLSNDEYVTKILTYNDGKLSGQNLTFELTFEVKPQVKPEYTITYKDDAILDSVKVEEGAIFTVENNMEKNGFNFLGWSNGNEIYEVGQTFEVMSDVTLTAVWEQINYTVTYKVGGNIVKVFNDLKYGDPVPSFDYTPADNEEFFGWADVPEMVTDNIEIIGTTGIKTYMVEFKDASGKVISRQVVEHGNKVVAPEAPAKNDVKVENGKDAAKWSKFTFVGWVGNGEYDVEDAVTQDMTFTATYKESTVKVYYYILNRGMAQPNEPASHNSKDYSKKGVEGSLKSFTAVANDDEKVMEVILDAPEASDFGITLNDGEYIKWYVVKQINGDKWHVDGIIVGQQYDLVVNYVDAKTKESIKESTKVSVAATEEYEVVTPEIEGYKLVDENATVVGVMPYDKVEVTLEYEKIQCTVKYIVNDELVDEFTVEYGDDMPTCDYKAPEGYEFLGWSEAPEKVTSDLEINGTIAKKLYTVTYKVDGEEVETFTVEYEDKVPTYNYKAPEGYEFSGWSEVPEKVTSNLEINGTTAIKTYTVTYKVNGEEVETFTVEYGSEVPASTYEVAEGYEFSGWSKVPEKVTSDLEINGTTTIKTFTVIYTVDGAVVDEFTVEYGSEVPASTYEVAEGYEFSGWSKVPEKVTSDLEINGTTTIKTFTVTYTVDGEVVDEYTVEYGSEVPTSTYEVPEGYEFTGFSLTELIEDATVVKQDMAFEGTTSLIVVEEEEEEDIESDIPSAPGTTEEEDNNTENDETVTDDVDNNKENDVVVDTDNNAANDVEEEEEEDLEIDTPFAPGTTEEEGNSTENNESVADDVDNNTGNDVVVDTDNNKENDVVADADNSKENDVVDTDNNTVSDVEEEEEEDLEIDTPFDSGVQTGDASNYSAYVAALLIAAVGAMVIAYNKKKALN